MYRSGLGEASLESILKLKIAETITKLDFTIEYGIHVFEDDVQQAHSHFAYTKEDIDRISELDTSGYVTEGKNHVNKIGERLEELKKNWPPFVTAKIEQKGILDDEDIQAEHSRIIEKLREESNNLLEQVRTEGAHSIDKAKELSEDIEGRARRVATKVSVEEAQKQFEGAQTALNEKVKLWALLSAISVLVFIFVAYKFSNEVPAENLKWGVVFLRQYGLLY